MAESGVFLLGLLLALVLAAVPGWAHHSRAAFDLDNSISVTGVVTEVAWTNPHYYLSVAEPALPQARQWTFEGHSVPGLVRNGWSKDTLQVGQQVQVVANPNKDAGIAFGLLDHVTRPDGSTYYSFRPKPGAGATQAHQAVEPSTDFSGTWRVLRSLRSNLVAGFGAPVDWPLTDSARAAVATYSMHDDPSLRCEDRGLPRMLQWPYAQRWRWQDDQLLIEREHSLEGRVVYAQMPAEVSAGKSGVSVYHHQPDGSLMMTTDQFVATRWGSTRGVDSSADKQLTEHYQLTEGGRVLALTYTIIDPPHLREPVVQTLRYAKVADFEFAEEPPCDTYTAQRHLQFEAEPAVQAN